MRFYAGIGSRQTPPDVLQKMEAIAECFAYHGFGLRSGGANGADSAFERGCDKAGGEKQIFLPWKKFNGHQSELWQPSEEATKLVKTILAPGHWSNLSAGGRLCHSRNCHQVLGPNLDDPVAILLCWTPGGVEQGGTATAIKLARSRGIRVVNLGADAAWASEQWLLAFDVWYQFYTIRSRQDSYLRGLLESSAPAAIAGEESPSAATNDSAAQS